MKLKYELRAWQKVALAKWRESGQRGIIQVVTGGGKTIFAEACIVDFLSTHPNGRIFVVVPSVALADQWAVSLEYELGIAPKHIRLAPRQKPEACHRIVIMVINSARNKERHVDLSGDWMLIVDECHRAGGEINRKAIVGQFKASLGLSATPERDYDNALYDAIIPALGEVIYKYSLAEARRDGVVTVFELVNVRINMLADEKKQYSRLSRVIAIKQRNNSPSDEETITNLLRRRARIANCATMRIPMAVKLIERHPNSRIMVFHEDVAAATTIEKMARERGHSVVMYHTRVGPSIRVSNLKLFRRGVYSTLICCRALDEGVNIPETQVAIIASASASIRQRIQRLGRVLRPAEGKSKAIIYTIYATDIEEERLLKEAEEMRHTDTADVSWMRVEHEDG
ncbi:DEAD/DEAH box helicase family protein [Planctomycetales bacterium ZRK34]|nr:DEAD/DEAH box helicase family protein [Planctomycetales bacterium ZRK34]